ncbi:MAG TPA: hypothetical protein DCL77_06745 [Prolixibacteraceae bacterium]|jgi:long-subunit fatty acid transport protein|nr:hypothetical protein [Prolixibacteraceae bacterium]
MKNKILVLLLPLLFVLSASAQEGPATWIELGFSKKVIKNLKVEFNPELRLRGDFQLDTYILEAGVAYKVHKYLSVGAYYRYEDAYDYKKSTGAYKNHVALNRIALDAKSGFELKRFDFSFRLRYTNGADFDQSTDDKTSFFRYRAKVDYNINGSKLVPFASVEVFHDLIVNQLDKTRYTAGLAYPFNKHHEVSVYYRLQDYYEPANYMGDKKPSLDIIGLCYNFDF